MPQPPKKHRTSSDSVSLGDRVSSALLTPVFFNIGLVIFLAMDSSSWQFARHLRSIYGSSELAPWVMLALPATVGFVAGSRGTSKILGHALWTNHESEKSGLATALVWLSIAALLIFAHRLETP
jgi:hypothetical protein